MDKWIRRLDDLGLEEVDLVGGKGANLGELIRAGFTVPGGFVVTAQAYLDAMDAAPSQSSGTLRQALVDDVAGVDVTDPSALAELSRSFQDQIRAAGMPEAMAESVTRAYEAAGGGAVAVRSSATNEDSADASFAGMNETYTNVVGAEELIERIVDCWSSVYGERVISYRSGQGIGEEPAIAVVVQHMVNSVSSGVMFTVDPSTENPNLLVIEAAAGLGEVVVGGLVEPDTYTVDRAAHRVREIRLGHQSFQIVRGEDGADHRVDLDDTDGARQVLPADRIVELADIGVAVEEYYGQPMDTEWALEGDQLFLVQARPITTLHVAAAAGSDDDGSDAPDELPEPLLTGLPASPGAVAGRVRVLADHQDGANLLEGEILVAQMTSPDWVPTMRRAAALVTDGGGMTCHAAIVSRELALPGIVGTRSATSVLRTGELVTVDGKGGRIFPGDVTAVLEPPSTEGQVVVSGLPTEPGSVEPLATRLYVNLAIAERALRGGGEAGRRGRSVAGRVHDHRRPGR